MKKKIINKEFWLSFWDTVIVKVGSNILAWNHHWVNLENMKNIIDWIDYLMEIWLKVILVSSWAVAVWKSISWKDNQDLNDAEKATMSTRWQAKLIDFYTNLIKEKKNIEWIAQILVDNTSFKVKKKKEELLEILDLNLKDKYLNILNENDAINREELKFSDNDELAWLVVEATKAKILILLSNIDWVYKNYWKENQELVKEVRNIKFWVLNIINENDTISREELKFSDNDELAWLVAEATKAKILVLLSNIDWVYKNYWMQNQELIKEVWNIWEVRDYCEDTKSSNWTGWMKSKLDVMKKMLNSWITWILANWAEENVLQEIFKWNWKKTIFRV